MDDRGYLDPAVMARLERLGPGFPGKLIALFLEHTPSRLEGALAGGRAGDWKAVEASAHSLKSSAGNLGAVRLHELADRIETAIAEGAAAGRLEDLHALLTELEATFSRTCDLLIAIKDGKTP